MLVLDHTRVARTKPNREPVRRILPHLEEEQHLKDLKTQKLQKIGAEGCTPR